VHEENLICTVKKNHNTKKTPFFVTLLTETQFVSTLRSFESPK